ncbi:MAG: sugar kinase [Firmicutes bacterium]|nr:sugar kinase [Bacillota bacterium]
MAKKVVTFGEIMLRLSPPGYQRFVQAGSFDVVYGGGEANVAVSLAGFGLDSYFVTRVPRHEIGQSAVNHLRRFGVRTDYIVRGGSRLGIYFLEMGASQRPSKVIYDRANSSISEISQGEIDWGRVFEGADWFHFTGITPALGDRAAAATLEAARTAKEMGLTVSADLNYRKNLWTPEKAREVMTGLMKYVDVVVANEEDADKVFGIRAERTDVTRGEIDSAAYRDVAAKLVEMFGFDKVAITLRESISAFDNIWSGMLFDGSEHLFSKKYPVHIVDRVGGGDAFAAGLIHGILSGKSSRDALEFAVAASCIKHSIFGDFNLVTVDEVEALAKGDTSGRVQR